MRGYFYIKIFKSAKGGPKRMIKFSKLDFSKKKPIIGGLIFLLFFLPFLFFSIALVLALILMLGIFAIVMNKMLGKIEDVEWEEVKENKFPVPESKKENKLFRFLKNKKL